MRTDPETRLARGEELQFRTARTGMTFVLMFCAGFTIIGLCLLGGGDGLIRMLGIALAVFFGLAGLPITIARLWRPALELTVSAERGVRLEDGPGWIPWSQIVRVDREVIAARPTLILRLTPAAQERWDAAAGLPDEPVPGGPGVIVPQTIAAGADRIMEALVAGRRVAGA